MHFIRRSFRPVLGISVLLAVSMAGSLAPHPAQAGGDDPVNYQNYPLGLLDGVAEHKFGENYLRIASMGKDSPLAKVGIQVRDEIIGVEVNDKAVDFLPDDTNYDTGGTGPLRTLGEAIDAAAGSSSGKMSLHIRAGRQDTWVAVYVPLAGRFGPDYPFNCKKSDIMFNATCNWMLKHRGGEGNLGGNVTTSLMGLAFMCNSGPAYAIAAKQAAMWTEKSMMKPESVGSNWMLAWAGIFLAEYNWRYPDEKRKATLQAICDELVKRQLKDHKGPEGDHAGTFFHGKDPCYGGKGLNIVTTAVMWCWASSAKLSGVKLDQGAWKLSYDYLKRSCGSDGAGKGKFIGYNASCVDDGQSAGRSAQWTQALLYSGDEQSVKWAQELARCSVAHSARSREAHAITSLGIINATAAIWRTTGKSGYRQHMDEWRWYMSLMMQPDGSARFVPGKANNGGDFYLGFDNAANCIAALMLAAPSRKLAMFGAGKPDAAGVPADAGSSDSGEYKIESTLDPVKPAAGAAAGQTPPAAKPVPAEPTSLFGVSLDGMKLKELGLPIIESNQWISEGRYSRALQRLDGMLNAAKPPADKQKQIADAMENYCYNQGLIPHIEVMEEYLAKQEALEAVRRYDQYKAEFPYGPRVKSRVQAVLDRIESPEIQAQAKLGLEYEQLLLYLNANPTVPINRQRMEAFARAHPDSPYGKKAQQAINSMSNGAPDMNK